MSFKESNVSNGYVQEWNPCAGLNKRVPHATVPQSVFKKYVANVTRSRKHGEDGEEDFKAMEIVTIRFDGKPKKDIVENRQHPGSGNTIYKICKLNTSTTRKPCPTVGKHVFEIRISKIRA